MLKPLSCDQWDFETAAHLLNRAGFGGAPREIERLAALGPDRAVASLVDYENIPDPAPDPDWAKPNPEEIGRFRAAVKHAPPDQKRQLQQEQRRSFQQRMMALRGWWLQRMAVGSRPLQEKMVLFWHGHFATSVEKVRNPYYMWRQNDLFRRFATGNWQRLLTETGKDPAMLIWLDQAQSHRDHPNENFAREVMELFALGEGHYTEKDITEGARALTGWSLDASEQKFIYRPRLHDDGVKRFLGRTGSFNGDDVMRIIVEQPQAARFITAKIWNYFTGQMPSEVLNTELAGVFRSHGNTFKPVLREMFRSEAFYSGSIVRNQVKSPVQWLVGSVRMLENELPPPVVSWGILRQLGQDLFAPPNVKGWDGGVTWITTNTLLARYNDAQSLVEGTSPPLQAGDLARQPGGAGDAQAVRAMQRLRLGGVKVDAILTPAQRAQEPVLLAALERRLFQTTLEVQKQETLRAFLHSKPKLSDADILTVIRLMMSTPDYQVT